MNKKYLVAYVIRYKSDFDNMHEDLNNYQVFVDNEDNLSEARKFYKELLKRDETYTSNLCEILDSTDY